MQIIIGFKYNFALLNLQCWFVIFIFFLFLNLSKAERYKKQDTGLLRDIDDDEVINCLGEVHNKVEWM